MLLSRVLLAMLIAAITTTVSFAAEPTKAPTQQQQSEETDQGLSLEDEELAD